MRFNLKFWKRKQFKDYCLAGKEHFIKYSDGYIMKIVYPKNCIYTRLTIGDYCWELAVAHEENTVEEFYKHCPCEFI